MGRKPPGLGEPHALVFLLATSKAEKVPPPDPIYDQNGQNRYLFMTKMAEKPYIYSPKSILPPGNFSQSQGYPFTLMHQICTEW